MGGNELVLWIHGYTMDSSIWEELWTLLPEWSHLGLDLPGHGASRAIHDEEDLRSLADTVASHAAREGARHVCALSFGTVLALEMASLHPHLFDTVVLAAPSLAGGPEEPSIAQRYRELAALYRRRGPGPHMAALWMRSPPDVFKGLDAHPSVKDHMTRVATRHTWGEMEGLAMWRLTTPPQREHQLARITADVLTLVGEEDMQAFKDSADLILQWVPRSARILLPSLGHLCLVEAPDRVAPLIRGHLAEHSKSMGGARNV